MFNTYFYSYLLNLNSNFINKIILQANYLISQNYEVENV